MTTLVTASPEEAASYIRSGEIVAFPTETVYGLGADAFDARAVRKIFEAKGRPSDNPLIVHISSIDEVDMLVQARTAVGDVLIQNFFPGPLTIILEKSNRVPDEVTADLETVGIRMPSHPVAARFLQACSRPVAAPSANRSGRPSATTWNAALDDLRERVPCILEGGRSTVGLESTVVDCTSSPPSILRAGAVSAERLQTVIPDIIVAARGGGGAPRSPGIRHPHYAPRAQVTIVDDPPPGDFPNAAYIGIDLPMGDVRFVRQCTSIEEYAYELFDFFRASDDHGVETIFCQRVAEVELGRALMDRIQRAANASKGG